MYPLPENIKTALRVGTTLEISCEAYSAGGAQLLASTEFEPLLTLDTSTGSIDVVRKAATTRSFGATVVDEAGVLVPTSDQPYLDPLKRPWMKFYCNVYDDPVVPFRIPIGVFVIETCLAAESTGGAKMDLTGKDPSTLISANKWTEPFDIGANGTDTYDKSIAAIITSRAVGWVPQFKFEPSPVITPPATFDDQADPWDEAQKLAQADGKELFVDMTGTFALRTVPDPKNTNPVWNFDDREFSTKIADTLTRNIDIANCYNGVIVSGSAPWLLYPVQGIAWDTDLNSPTYYKGPFGMRAKQIDNPMATDDTTANAAAAAELKNVLGVNEEVSFEAVPLYALESGDVATVGSDKLVVADVALLESFSIPLDISQTMHGTCRRQRRG